MLTQEEAVEIRVMARRGEGVRSIAKQLGCSRNTVRRYLREQQASRYWLASTILTARIDSAVLLLALTCCLT
jgi:transposase